LNRHKNFESVTVEFQVSVGFRILGKVPDSVGFGCGFRICYIPNLFSIDVSLLVSSAVQYIIADAGELYN